MIITRIESEAGPQFYLWNFRVGEGLHPRFFTQILQSKLVKRERNVNELFSYVSQIATSENQQIPETLSEYQDYLEEEVKTETNYFLKECIGGLWHPQLYFLNQDERSFVYVLEYMPPGIMNEIRREGTLDQNQRGYLDNNKFGKSVQKMSFIHEDVDLSLVEDREFPLYFAIGSEGFVTHNKLEPENVVREIINLESEEAKADSKINVKMSRKVAVPTNVSNEIRSERDYYFDVKSHFTFTVDPKNTKVYEDAISYKSFEKNEVIGFHVLNISSDIPENSDLDRRAGDVFKKSFSDDLRHMHKTLRKHKPKLSLNKGEEKKAFSLFLLFDRETQCLKGYFFTLSLIRVDKNYAEEPLEQLLEKESANDLKKVLKILKRREASFMDPELNLINNILPDTECNLFTLVSTFVDVFNTLCRSTLTKLGIDFHKEHKQEKIGQGRFTGPLRRWEGLSNGRTFAKLIKRLAMFSYIFKHSE